MASFEFKNEGLAKDGREDWSYNRNTEWNQDSQNVLLGELIGEHGHQDKEVSRQDIVDLSLYEASRFGY